MLAWLIIFYLLAGLALYFLQEKLMFHPKPLARNHRFNIASPHEEVYIPISEATDIHLIKIFPPARQPKGVVLYFHGNRGNVEGYAPYTKIFTDNGYEVWMPDYPGYGKSRGKPTEENLYLTGMQVRDMAAARFEPGNIILYGKSLGTGVATYVAANSQNKMLVLETPYASIPSLFQTKAWMYPASLMARYRMDNLEHLKRVTMPVYIFQGTLDAVVPILNAHRLRHVLKKGDDFFTLIGRNHINVNSAPFYLEEMKRLLE